jgi:hypothetical protein
VRHGTRQKRWSGRWLTMRSRSSCAALTRKIRRRRDRWIAAKTALFKIGPCKWNRLEPTFPMELCLIHRAITADASRCGMAASASPGAGAVSLI